MKYEAERKSMIQAALTMLQYQLIALAGGNVALRMPCGNFLVTPSAMAYELSLIHISICSATPAGDFTTSLGKKPGNARWTASRRSRPTPRPRESP